jgi:hypothetical protein
VVALAFYLISANLPLGTKSVIPEVLLVGNPVSMNSQQLPFDKLRRALSKHLLVENYELLQVHQFLTDRNHGSPIKTFGDDGLIAED